MSEVSKEDVERHLFDFISSQYAEGIDLSGITFKQLLKSLGKRLGVSRHEVKKFKPAIKAALPDAYANAQGTADDPEEDPPASAKKPRKGRLAKRGGAASSSGDESDAETPAKQPKRKRRRADQASHLDTEGDFEDMLRSPTPAKRGRSARRGRLSTGKKAKGRRAGSSASKRGGRKGKKEEEEEEEEEEGEWQVLLGGMPGLATVDGIPPFRMSVEQLMARASAPARVVRGLLAEGLQGPGPEVAAPVKKEGQAAKDEAAFEAMLEEEEEEEGEKAAAAAGTSGESQGAIAGASSQPTWVQEWIGLLELVEEVHLEGALRSMGALVGELEALEDQGGEGDEDEDEGDDDEDEESGDAGGDGAGDTPRSSHRIRRAALRLWREALGLVPLLKHRAAPDTQLPTVATARSLRRGLRSLLLLRRWVAPALAQARRLAGLQRGALAGSIPAASALALAAGRALRAVPAGSRMGRAIAALCCAPVGVTSEEGAPSAGADASLSLSLPPAHDAAGAGLSSSSSSSSSIASSPQAMKVLGAFRCRHAGEHAAFSAFQRALRAKWAMQGARRSGPVSGAGAEAGSGVSPWEGLARGSEAVLRQGTTEGGEGDVCRNVRLLWTAVRQGQELAVLAHGAMAPIDEPGEASSGLTGLGGCPRGLRLFDRPEGALADAGAVGCDECMLLLVRAALGREAPVLCGTTRGAAPGDADSLMWLGKRCADPSHDAEWCDEWYAEDGDAAVEGLEGKQAGGTAAGVLPVGGPVSAAEAAAALGRFADGEGASTGGVLRPGRWTRVTSAPGSEGEAAEPWASWVVFDRAQVCVEACVWVKGCDGSGLGNAGVP